MRLERDVISRPGWVSTDSPSLFFESAETDWVANEPNVDDVPFRHIQGVVEEGDYLAGIGAWYMGDDPDQRPISEEDKARIFNILRQQIEKLE